MARLPCLLLAAAAATASALVQPVRRAVRSTAHARMAVPSPRPRDVDADGTVEGDAGVRVTESPGKGYGAFATKAFEAETIVGDYVGERMTQRDVDGRYKGKSTTPLDLIWLASRRTRGVGATGDYIFQVEPDLYVDAEDPVHANWCRYVNHDSDANMRVKSLAYAFGGEPRVWFVATRDIAAGDELCFDYGDDYWFEDDNILPAEAAPAAPSDESSPETPPSTLVPPIRGPMP